MYVTHPKVHWSDIEELTDKGGNITQEIIRRLSRGTNYYKTSQAYDIPGKNKVIKPERTGRRNM